MYKLYGKNAFPWEEYAEDESHFWETAHDLVSSVLNPILGSRYQGKWSIHYITHENYFGWYSGWSFGLFVNGKLVRESRRLSRSASPTGFRAKRALHATAMKHKVAAGKPSSSLYG
jgi:hypothetical protein